jgi:predicted RNase H-like HicB family nuclease
LLSHISLFDSQFLDAITDDADLTGWSTTILAVGPAGILPAAKAFVKCTLTRKQGSIQATLLRRAACAIHCCPMHNEFTAIIERDGDWFVAQCPEVPEANGQGRTPDEAKSDLAAAIQLVLEDRREDALKAASSDALRDVVTVGS